MSLCLSINTKPGEMYQIFDGLQKSINALRFLIPLLMVTISLLILVFLIFNKKINKTSIILILFTLYFVSQILGLINTSSRDFTLENTYLVIFALGTLSVLILLDSYQSKKISCTIFTLTFSIFTFAYIFILLKTPEFFFLAIQDGSLYNLFNIHQDFFGQSSPRITGATRIFGVFALICLAFTFVKKNNNKINYLFYILVILLSLFVWLGQSRGSLLCYYATLIFLIFFLNDLNFLKKIILIISIPLISISLSNILLKYSTEVSEIYVEVTDKQNILIKEIKEKSKKIKEKEIEEKKFKNKKFKNKKSNLRVLEDKTTSGRFQIWSLSLKKYEKNKIFGYGPQADRYLLFNSEVEHLWSTNSSNLLIYGFLSGGYVGLIFLILIYFYIFLMILKFSIVNKMYLLKYTVTKNNIFYVLSITTTIFFLIRSLFENSYGLFSIDFLLMIVSLYILELNYRKKQT
tara:strand:- start:2640 stop:4025 length:1386 start_codon:yes stop_codon:yes gene_type:complete